MAPRGSRDALYTKGKGNISKLERGETSPATNTFLTIAIYRGFSTQPGSNSCIEQSL